MEDNVLQIDLKKSSDKNGPPARRVLTYNLLCDFTEIENILDHFNIGMEDVEALIKPTPAIPSLLIVLKEKLSEWIKEKEIRREPYLLYQPAPQSERMGRTQIWAHITLEDNQFDRRVTIEGIFKRVSNEEIMHTLKYHGEILSEPKPVTWKGTDFPNGDLVVNMRIHNEFTFIMIKGEPYKASYAKQEKNCNHCFSWNHRSPECQRWDADVRTLMFDYYQKWQRQVGFKEFQPLKDYQADDKKTPQKLPEGNTIPARPQKQDTEKQDGDEELPIVTQNAAEDNEAHDKDDLNPGALLDEFGTKYNQQGINQKFSLPAHATEKKQTEHAQRRLFEEDPDQGARDPVQEAASTNEREGEEGVSKERPGKNEKEPGESKKEKEPNQGEKTMSSTEDAKKDEESAEDGKKRKHDGISATKLTPESKKVHVNENQQLLKELEKIEKDATKKDLTGVKKKILKRRLDELITSKKEVIKRMQEDDRGVIEQTESRIRSFVERDK